MATRIWIGYDAEGALDPGGSKGFWESFAAVRRHQSANRISAIPALAFESEAAVLR
jgi:hypothetical protein